LMLWIKGSLTPKQIRDRLEKKDGQFQAALTAYLEGAHQGEYINSTGGDMIDTIANADSEIKGVPDPTLTLPKAPPPDCLTHKKPIDSCKKCSALKVWWCEYEKTTNELIYRCNRHTCHPGCTSAKYPDCKSRFPRDVIPQTTVDAETQCLHLKHGEANLNIFSSPLTYLLRCNSDVTSLTSGTAINAIIQYVTNYITKSALKTHVMFEVIKGVFSRNQE
ncbi:hypothetical protein DENSPDRAFT_753698, partial [Dentipellis sp. KUC8613]